MLRISMKSLSLSQTQEVGATFIDQTKNILISFLAAKSVIQGDITLGIMMSLQYIIGQLNAPVQQFISFVQATQDAALSLERLNEIQQMQDEESENDGKLREIPEGASIEFKNVIFQYGGSDSLKVLDGVSFNVPNNKVTAIVGASGSGKTTILKMMLGFYHPVSGNILLGDKSLDKYSESIWRYNCGTVMQDGYIFSDTIAGNIGISDDCPDMERVRVAANVANIDDWVSTLPLRYSTRIGADGHGLSVGQKQRILIARAAYKNAKYLFFDEATNALDANNECLIMSNLDSLFCNKTVVIVAHRLSTICKADNIIVLAKGQIAEQGTHRELLRLKGIYYNLIKNQLDNNHINR